MRNILVLAMVLSLLMVIIPFAPVSAANPVVTLTAPANVAPGGSFYATINITGASQLKNYQLILSFNPNVVQMAGLELSTGSSSGVIDGVINGVTIPNFGWTYRPVAGTPSGSIILGGNIAGNNSVSGDGFLARILLKSTGAAGAATNLALSSIDLGDALGNEVFPADPVAPAVTVSSNAALTTALTTGAAGSVTGTTATLNGTLTSLGTASSVNLFLGYSKVQGGPYTLVDKGTATTASTLPFAFNAPITGLTAGTTYYYVAQAQYGSPTQIVNGAEMTFNTTGGSLLPTLTSLNPGSGAPGATLNGVVVTGTNLTGATALTFSGTGVTASNIVVTNATQLTATITISGAAALGLRNVTVTAAGGTSAALVEGFSVTSAGAAVMSLTAPANVAVGGSFYLTINITGANNLKNYQLKMGFDPAVVQMAGLELSTGVTSGLIDGLINGVTIPNFGWTYQPVAGIPSGLISLGGNIEGNNSVSGNGYLVRILLKTVGAAGSQTSLNLSAIDLGDSLGNETFPANPAPVTVVVSSNPALFTAVTTNAVTGLSTTTATLNGTLTVWVRPRL